MIKVKISDQFLSLYPEAHVGVLALKNLRNANDRAGFDEEKNKIIQNLKEQFPDRQHIKEHPVIQAYSVYYKRFGKTYHLIGQVESAAQNMHMFSGKHPAVEAMFLSELKNSLLTAGHDLSCMKGGLEITAADGSEIYTGISGQEIQAKKGDMLIRDENAPISTVMYGPDFRTRITNSTKNAVYTVYVPEGISRSITERHLHDISHLISLVYPSAKLSLRQIFP